MMKFLLIFAVVLGACSTHAPVERVRVAPQRTMRWEELAPYIGRHIGMRANERFLFTFDIGGEFGGAFPSDLSPEIDQWVQAALKKNHAPIAGVLISLVEPGILVQHRLDKNGKKIPLTEAEINLGAQRLWQAVLTEDPPVARSYLKYLIARELAGKIQIEGVSLQPTLSAQQEIHWDEIEPYVTSFLKVVLLPSHEKTPTERLGVRICMTDNNLSKKVRAEAIDWQVAMNVFDALAGQLQDSPIFNGRMDRTIMQKARALNLDPQALATLTEPQKKAALAELELDLHRNLFKNYALLQTVKGAVAYQFEQSHLPPLVD